MWRRERAAERTVSWLLLMGLLLGGESAQADFSQDTFWLTLRAQQSVLLDSALALEIEAGLTAARTAVPSVQHIHVLPEYVLNQLTLVVTPEATWSQAWTQGRLLTGDASIDSLSTTFHLTRVDWGTHARLFALHFDPPGPLAIPKLAALYTRHPQVESASPNGIGYVAVGPPPGTIDSFQKEGHQHFVFSEWRSTWYYWYISVSQHSGQWVVTLEEERAVNPNVPTVYRWNIPAWYEMTGFLNEEVILQTITQGRPWWMRRHAIEGTWRLVVERYPRGADWNHHWNILKAGLRARYMEVLEILRYATSDPDADVQASARRALQELERVPGGVPSTLRFSSQIPATFGLSQNAPNPFNPTTRIRYHLPQDETVRLVIYNTLGQPVKELVNGDRIAGTHTVLWDGTDQAGRPVASGVYYYRLHAGSFVQTRRMVFVK